MSKRVAIDRARGPLRDRWEIYELPCEHCLTRGDRIADDVPGYELAVIMARAVGELVDDPGDGPF